MATERILVVDDDPVSRQLLRRQLEQAGWTVVEADGGEAALEQVQQNPPKLLLLDVVMPGLNGFEVCRRLREQPSTRGLPVILVTGLEDRDSRVVGLEAGADDFITKPIDRSELTARVRSLLRLRYYQSLSTQREVIEAAFDGLAEGLVVTDAAGLVLTANRPACRLLGWPLAAAGEANLRDRLAQFDCAPTFESVVARPGGGELTLRRPGEPPLLIDGRLSQINDSDGRLAYLTLSLRDVTEERAAAQRRSDYLSLTAHKMRTPITILRGLIDMLVDDEGGEQGAELVREMAPDLAAKLDDMAAIVDHLTTLERLDEQPAWPAESSCLDEVAEQVIDRLRERYQERLPRIRRRYLEHEVALPAADLALVLGELLINATKFGRDEGALIELVAEPLDQRVLLLVRDNGCGIPHEAQDRVFEECFQVGGNCAGRTPGMGLGLAVVRRLLEAHGGSIEVACSAADCGTTMRLMLPAAAYVVPDLLSA